MSFKSNFKNKQIFSWALYDWANSAFATTVMAGFFPVFFKEFWSAGVSATESSYRLGLGNSLGGLILALLAPFLGTLADRGSNRKNFLLFFTVLGITGTAAMATVPQGAMIQAIFWYALAGFGFAASTVFYDSLLVDVAPANELDSVSGFGYALGYLGGGLLFVLNVFMVLKPQLFGLSGKIEAIQISFLTVAIWWALFSMPLFLNVKEAKQNRADSYVTIMTRAIRELWGTLQSIRTQKNIFYFLFAYFFYIEAVNTTIKMAVDYGMALGFKSQDLIGALIIVQFVAFPFAILFGWIGERFGAKKGIYICLAVYIANTLLALQMTSVSEFYVLAAFIGTVQGGVQALSRSLYASLIPAEKAGEYFGFFNMLGKFSAVIGPFLVGWVSVTTNNPRSSIGVILAFFVIGAFLLTNCQSSRPAAR